MANVMMTTTTQAIAQMDHAPRQRGFGGHWHGLQRRWRGGGVGGGREAEFAVENSVSVGVFMNDLRRGSRGDDEVQQATGRRWRQGTRCQEVDQLISSKKSGYSEVSLLYI